MYNILFFLPACTCRYRLIMRYSTFTEYLTEVSHFLFHSFSLREVENKKFWHHTWFCGKCGLGITTERCCWRKRQPLIWPGKLKVASASPFLCTVLYLNEVSPWLSLNFVLYFCSSISLSFMSSTGIYNPGHKNVWFLSVLQDCWYLTRFDKLFFLTKQFSGLREWMTRG